MHDACLAGACHRMLLPMATPSDRSDPVQLLRDEFRRHLNTFYARLKLAPPYHSVEKAILHLTTILHAMEPDERSRIAADPALRWGLFRRAFEESGLHLKHRGIIAGLARSPLAAELPSEYKPFLDAFTS